MREAQLRACSAWRRNDGTGSPAFSRSSSSRRHGQELLAAVERIADARVAEVREMQPDLVRPARHRIGAQVGEPAQPLDHLVEVEAGLPSCTSMRWRSGWRGSGPIGSRCSPDCSATLPTDDRAVLLLHVRVLNC